MTDQNYGSTEPDILRFGFGEAALGTVLVARSSHGVVALFLGCDRSKLERDLKDAFPGARLRLDPAGLAETIAKAVALVEAPHRPNTLKLDLRGTPLELAVWRALQAIPPGETRSYGAVARSVGGSRSDQKSVRESDRQECLPLPATAQDVGAACAANRIAVAIPCHRVVKADGSISGYRWGVQRKRRLINSEGVAGWTSFSF